MNLNVLSLPFLCASHFKKSFLNSLALENLLLKIILVVKILAEPKLPIYLHTVFTIFAKCAV